MRLLRVQLSDYRNFHRLDLSLGPGASVFIGANAQGKTNLLEAVYLLATMKELRAESEAQVIRREAAADPIPAARVVGEGETAAGLLKVEVVVVGREGSNGLIASKTVKVNGVPKRLSDAVGRLTAVLFTAADIDLISGVPSARRRYIDITLSQVDARYVAAGMTLQGPHRDDIAFFLDGVPAAGFSSRAQQRTIALALRLAEARLLDARRGEPPLLLLDDILSEMDAARGRSVIEAVSAYDQLLITATDLERFPDGFLDRAAVFWVTAGAVSVAASQPIASRGTAES